MEKIIIFDTTLRDGEQSAGASMSPEDKLLIAKNLDSMKPKAVGRIWCMTPCFLNLVRHSTW